MGTGAGPRPRAFVARALPEDTLRPLAAVAEVRVWPEAEVPVPRARLLEEAAAADGLLVMLTDRVDAALLDAAPRLRAVSTMSVGYDHVDVAACTRRGVAVCHTPDVLTETTADLAFALLLAAARRLPEAERSVREGRWGAWSPFFLAGQDVHGATLGVVGLGRIGQAVARRAQGFGMRILYAGRRERPEAAALGAERVPLERLAREADFVVLTAALTPETHHLVDAAFLAAMKETAILVNVGRGGLVDEAALVAALRAGRPGGAALDVFEREPLPPDHPLLRLPNVVLVPHIGSATVATRRAMAELAADNLARVLAGERPRACVNPEVLGA
jgi:glyoxylate reductase